MIFCRHTKKKTTVYFLAILILTWFSGCLSSTDEDKQFTVVIVQNNWGTSQLNAEVAKQLIESELGYNVELVSLDENAQWPEIARGDAHISLEVWPTAHHDNRIEFVEKQQRVVYAGELGPVGRIGWYIPSYVTEKYPQAATWEGLNDPNIAAYFATAETGEKGQFLAPGRQDHTFDEAIIENLNLPFEVVYAGSEQGILAGVKAAVDRQAPILFYLWTPHLLHAEVALTEVTLPLHYDGCHDNPNTVNCGYPDERLYKIIWHGLQEEAPDIDQFIHKMTYSLEDQISMLAEVDRNESTAEQAARYWIENNESIWRSWLPEQRNQTN